MALTQLVVAALSGACGALRPADTVVYASGADLESANPLVTSHPLARQVQRYALFVTLARLDSALQPVPYLAQRWGWSDGGRRLSMHLFSGLRWHDGVAVTAHDAVFTIEAARDPAIGFPRAAELSGLVAAFAPDDSTLVLRFAKPPPRFPVILAELPLVPRHILARVPRQEWRSHQFAVRPVGNGPFRFVAREAGRRWIFERNDAFPEALGRARLRRFIIAVVDEPATKFAGLVSGDLDVAGIAPAMASLVARTPGLKVVSYPVLFATALIFNCTRPPFDDVRVRLAIDALLDRRRIVEVALAGHGDPAEGPLRSDHPWFQPQPRPSRSRALELLDEAGWQKGTDGWRRKGGQELAFTLLSVGSGDNSIEQLIQSDLRSAGIKMEIRLAELGAFLAAARSNPKRFDAILAGIPGDLTLSHLAAMFDGSQAGSTLDYAGFHTAELDRAFASTRSSEKPADEARAWAEVQRLLAEELPASWIYHARGVQGVSRSLSGVRMDWRGELVSLAQWERRREER
jgi:peptide/nickel transport system substrate-binding protein